MSEVADQRSIDSFFSIEIFLSYSQYPYALLASPYLSFASFLYRKRVTETPQPNESGERLKVPPAGMQIKLGPHQLFFKERAGFQLGDLVTVYSDLAIQQFLLHTTSPTEELSIGTARDINTIELTHVDGVYPRHLTAKAIQHVWQIEKGIDVPKEELIITAPIKPLTLHPNDRLPPQEWMQTVLAPYSRIRFRLVGNPYRLELTRFEENPLLLVGEDTTFPIPDGKILHIGRHSTNDVSLPDADGVSRFHLALFYLDERLYVIDRGSKNGTSLALAAY